MSPGKWSVKEKQALRVAAEKTLLGRCADTEGLSRKGVEME
jgi:hypothetical protein